MRQSNKYHVAAIVYDLARCTFAFSYRSRPCLMSRKWSARPNRRRGSAALVYCTPPYNKMGGGRFVFWRVVRPGGYRPRQITRLNQILKYQITDFKEIFKFHKTHTLYLYFLYWLFCHFRLWRYPHKKFLAKLLKIIKFSVIIHLN